MKFPCRIEALTEPLKIDLLQPLASARLVLHPQQDTYGLQFWDRPDVSLAVRVRPPSSDTDSPEGSASEPTPKMPGAGARDYLELHGVLKYVQSMLTALIQTRPQDPYLFMLHQLKSVKAYCEDSTPTTPVDCSQSSRTSPGPATSEPLAAPRERSLSAQAPARPRQPAERSGAPAPPLHARDLLARVPPAAAAELRDPEESRRRLQAVLLTASRNGVWESVLQAVFKSPTCACGDGHCSEHREHHEACEHCLPQDEVARSKQEKQRGQREGRGELEAAKASGGGADLVDPELNVLGPEKSRSVRSLKAEIRVITQERQELHREVERLRQQLHRPDHGPT